MSLWIDMLKLGAQEDAERAREILYFEIPSALRQADLSNGGRYKGVVPEVTRRFIGNLPESERGMAISRADDFVDYIVDKVVAGIERTLLLVEFCCAHPDQRVDKLAQEFTGWSGLKRNQEYKAKYVADNLHSMIKAGVALPAAIASTVSVVGEPQYEFNEIAFARGWQMEFSWSEFKEDAEIDKEFRWLNESDFEEEPDPSAEAIDYGSISVGRVVLNLTKFIDKETELDFQKLSEEISSEIVTLLESYHQKRSQDGYKPIAWHNVFWDVWLEYKGLYLRIEMRDPHCAVDHQLADHIAANYPEVTKPKRLNIARRRKAFHDECRALILARLKSWAGTFDSR